MNLTCVIHYWQGKNNVFMIRIGRFIPSKCAMFKISCASFCIAFVADFDTNTLQPSILLNITSTYLLVKNKGLMCQHFHIIACLNISLWIN